MGSKEKLQNYSLRSPQFYIYTSFSRTDRWIIADAYERPEVGILCVEVASFFFKFTSSL